MAKSKNIEQDLDFSESNDWLFGNDVLETRDTNETELFSQKAVKQQFIRKQRKQKFSDILKRLPDNNEYFHIVSNGEWDFFSIVDVLADLLGGIDVMYGSTWTMSQMNVRDLEIMYKSGKIKEINMFTGTYFKRRESSVYNYLVNFILNSKQKYKCFENHSKILLLHNTKKQIYIVVEGSANFTMNPRTEQFVMTNSKELYEFHKKWLDKIN